MMTIDTPKNSAANPQYRQTNEHRGPVLRGLAAGGLFAIVVALPALPRLWSGYELDLAFFLSWYTPFAVGAGLWPIHKRLAKLVLWSSLYVSVSTFLLSAVTMTATVLWPNNITTFRHAGAQIDYSIGLAVFLVGLFTALPMIGNEVRKQGFSWFW